MKKFVLAVLIGLSVVSLSFLARSVSAETFDVEVNIPAANAADFTVFKLFAGQAFPTTPETTTDLSFDLTFFPDFNGVPANVFLGDFFYAIDVSPTGGVGQMNVDVTYDDLVNQNAGVDTGLSVKGIATVVRVESGDQSAACQNQNECPEVQLSREIFRDIGGTVLATDLETNGGFMRMYVGLSTGDPNATPAEPADAVPFNLGDAPGQYLGRITLTAMQP